MAEHTHSGRAELGAPMDYPEHERTYAGFVAGAAVTAMATIAIVQSLVLFGIAANGFWLGALLLLLTFICTTASLMMKGNTKPLIGVIVLGFVFMALTLG